MSGIDTVKLSYPMRETQPGWEWVQDLESGWSRGRLYGTMGPLWFTERVHEDGTRVVIKGIGADAFLLWEGSVPKFLGIAGVSEPDDVRVVDQHLRRIGPKGLPRPTLRRVDLTEDVHDPNGTLRRAALGWKPHSRARYRQAEYHDPTTGGHTVFQHNKSRGVRVYDNFADKQLEWARDTTRIEYQMRGDWLQKQGLDRLYEDFDRNCARTMDPLVAELLMRRDLVEAVGPRLVEQPRP